MKCLPRISLVCVLLAAALALAAAASARSSPPRGRVGRKAKQPRPPGRASAKTLTNGRDGARVVFVPGGTFRMGDKGEGGEQQVQGFRMYATPVTNAQYRKFLAANP